MSEENKNIPENQNNEPQYSLNDDRRIKVLSPGALVRRRFLRNRIAVVGLVILIMMFLFSFVGGWVSPYKEDQLFYRTDMQSKQFAAVTENKEYQFIAADSRFSSALQAQMFLAMTKNQEEFTYRDITYQVEKTGDDMYTCSLDNEQIGFASKQIISSSIQGASIPFATMYELVKAYENQEDSFKADGHTYTIDEDGGVFEDGKDYAYISKYVVRPLMADVFLSRAFKEELVDSIMNGDEDFIFKEADGQEYEYVIQFDPRINSWSINQQKETRVFDTYSPPSKDHWLGTDKNGMDMLTRLMYGGRVSLTIGFIVEIISTVLGVILGGISGYFGKWVDMLIMRIVDIFYCVPSTPLIIILGAAMDAMHVDPKIRMIYLMLILGFLGWPGIAHMVRGQILSLREQEFMIAAEATGLSVKRKILQHLIPNVIPQLIVSITMGLGGTILTEATLSFLGLGVKFPFASWGNIINDVNNTFVLTNYWFVWIPAGTLLLLTVLAFNLVGDGLRDAFDPRMKR
ncbi:MAG: ABC transporter permease [Solobacterium sp.]|nr:ABC transporter permease [Solobacterium sp.]